MDKIFGVEFQRVPLKSHTKILTYTFTESIPGKTFIVEGPGGRLNKKDGLTRYGNSHVKDKTS